MDLDVYRYCCATVRNTARALLIYCLSDRACSAPNVLNLSSHADTFIAPAINAVVGPGVVDASIYVDYDINLGLTDLTQPSSFTFSVASGAQVSHVPYGIVNYAFCCSAGSGDDAQYYHTLYDANAILSTSNAFAVGGLLPDGTAPPTYNTATSSPNSSNGGTGWGIEFGLTAGYLGLDTTEDSWNSAAMAGFLAALRYEHPSWTWFDVKAALRQTASHWPTGYSHTAYGYGLVDWSAANALTSTGSLYLQPPGLQITLTDASANITLYPFRQTRRQREVIYSINPVYSWPTGRNELTSVDLTAAGATLIYTSNGTDVIPSTSIARPATEPLWIVALTTDGAGHYSRLEEFSARRIADRGLVDVPVPLWANLILTGSLLVCASSGKTRTNLARPPVADPESADT